MSPNSPGAVVVTGSSTGIGRAAVLALARRGHLVFAGVRRTEDAETLLVEGDEERIRPVFLDVTKPEQIEAARKTVEAEVGERGLRGIVNNAGIGIAAPVEHLELERLRWQMEVNFFGLHAVTQAFFPLVRRARGRVVNVSSISGRVANPLVGAYCASKFAVEALSDSLRQELRPWGIDVALVQPGTIDTPIFDKTNAEADEMLERMSEEGRRLYQGHIDAIRAIVEHNQKNATPPSAVADVIVHAIESGRPKTRYLVGNNARAQAFINWLLPDRWADAFYARFIGLPSRLD